MFDLSCNIIKEKDSILNWDNGQCETYMSEQSFVQKLVTIVNITAPAQQYIFYLSNVCFTCEA